MMSIELSINTIPDWLKEQLDVGHVMSPVDAYEFVNLLDRCGKVHLSHGEHVYLGVAQDSKGHPVGLGGLVTPHEGMEGCAILPPLHNDGEPLTIPFTVMRPPHPFTTETSKDLLNAIDTEFARKLESNESTTLGAPWHAAIQLYSEHLEQLLEYGLLVTIDEKRKGLDAGRLMTLQSGNILHKVWLQLQTLGFFIRNTNQT